MDILRRHPVELTSTPGCRRGVPLPHGAETAGLLEGVMGGAMCGLRGGVVI
ncbi:MAG: hypothetical protein ACK4SY_10330 [Pyrobaculum sp.]